MPRTRLSLLATAAGLVALGGCSPGNEPTPKEVLSFHEDLARVAAEYKTWARVDDGIRWAPFDCRMPLPARPQFSASPEEETHGQKLYVLFARNVEEYRDTGGSKPASIGQAIVKESWIPEETDVNPDAHHDPFSPFATRGDKAYKTGRPAGLFIMMKVDPTTRGTDGGWVYGTVNADGKTVTACGRVESCMNCHQVAKHDRLFGLARE